MKYFIDTEFLEGKQSKWFGKTKPTIDLISIGIVAEDNREYYAISKDFNLKEAWNRFDKVINKHYPLGPEYNKIYWIRDNVLKPIWEELHLKDLSISYKAKGILQEQMNKLFTYSNFKKLINKYGKTNKQIAEEIKYFVANRPIGLKKEQWVLDYDTKNVHFYGYYCDYDWVVFCWLFGNMIDLPKGFPMYCIDLKQTLDEKAKIMYDTRESYCDYYTPSDKLVKHVQYPKQINEHNALADARFNRDLYNFLNTI